MASVDHAVARDPDFKAGRTLPVMRVETPLPDPLSKNNPLYINLKDDGAMAPWILLLNGCGGELGTAAIAWLYARDEIRRYLERGQSVNLLVRGNPKWRELLEHLQGRDFPDLAVVDLDDGRTTTREGLVATILKKIGSPKPVEKGGDLSLSPMPWNLAP